MKYIYKILLSCYSLAKQNLIATANDSYSGSHHMAMKKTPIDASCLIPVNETTKLKPVDKLSNLNTCAYDD